MLRDILPIQPRVWLEWGSSDPLTSLIPIKPGREFAQTSYNRNRDQKGPAAIAAGPFVFSEASCRNPFRIKRSQVHLNRIKRLRQSATTALKPVHFHQITLLESRRS